MDPNTGEQIINWERSKVVFLKMSNIYVNPDGLGPTWSRGEGYAYESLRKEVIAAVSELKNDYGVAPLASAVLWEDAGERLKLPSNRIGDIVVVMLIMVMGCMTIALPITESLISHACLFLFSLGIQRLNHRFVFANPLR